MIANQYGAPNPAEVMAENPARPAVVKVKYLHSGTAAWVARSRVLGPAPARTADRAQARPSGTASSWSPTSTPYGISTTTSSRA